MAAIAFAILFVAAGMLAIIETQRTTSERERAALLRVAWVWSVGGWILAFIQVIKEIFR